MDIAAILASIESSGLAVGIRDSFYLFPLFEAFHVLGLTLVFGTIAIMDFRLLGIASVRRPVTRITSDVLKWTWAAFILTVATGILMFITNAAVYYDNTFFRAKIVLLLLAGVNMLVFEFTTGRTVKRWEREPAAPTAGITAAALSLVLWIAIIFVGRWIGFTTSQTEVDLDPDIDIEQLFNFDELFPAGGAAAPEGEEGAAPEAPPE